MTRDVDLVIELEPGNTEGGREFDRLVDRGMTFRETLEWLEETETLALRMTARGLPVGEE